MQKLIIGIAASLFSTIALAGDDTRVVLDDPLKTGIFSYHQKLILGDQIGRAHV